MCICITQGREGVWVQCGDQGAHHSLEVQDLRACQVRSSDDHPRFCVIVSWCVCVCVCVCVRAYIHTILYLLGYVSLTGYIKIHFTCYMYMEFI